MQKVLITGASGLIGKELISELLNHDFEVNTLTRKKFECNKKVKQFLWNIEKGGIEERAFDGVATIIHLAGAGVADESWTAVRKKELWNSRINATKLLYQKIAALEHSSIKKIISASAVGFYGDRGATLLTEKSKAGTGFLADLCVAWEKEADAFSALGIEVAKTRIGIVISEKGGALPEMMKTVKFGVGGYFAKPDLYYPWIHISDIVSAFRFLAEHEELSGVFNFTAPKPVTHQNLMKATIAESGKFTLLVPAPSFALKLAMGEMADMLLNSQNCRPKALLDSGFEFKFSEVDKAMKDCFKTAKD